MSIGSRYVMYSASSAVENGMKTTASRNTRWIHVSRWSLRAM